MAQPAYRVKDINPGMGPGTFSVTGAPTTLGSDAFFGAEEVTNRAQLWKTDGQADGTFLLESLPPTADGPPRSFARLGNALLFFTNTNLWKTDGTAEGTVFVRHFQYPAWTRAVEWNGRIYFAADDGASGFELWASDGTEAGTQLVVDLESGPGGSAPTDPILADGRLFFFASSSSVGGLALWRSDGTSSGTVSVHVLGSDELLSERIAFGSRVLFLTERLFETPATFALWISDGSEAGTLRLHEFVGDSFGGVCPGSCPPPLGPSDLTAFDSVAVFVANDGVHGRELWRTDGTPAGTALVQDVRPGLEASMSFGLRRVGDQVFFGADDGVHGSELWRTDGTESGTRLVKDADPGPVGALPCCILPAGELEGRLLYAGAPRELWSSDGTEAGTGRVRRLTDRGEADPFDFVEVGGAVAFFVSGSAGASGLWRTDGTESGTVRIAEFPAGTGTDITPLADGGGTLYFSAKETQFGRPPVLWKTDGSEAGTVPIREFASIGAGLAASGTAFLGGSLYFSAAGGDSGVELWRTDGTPEGTALVKDIYPGPGGTTRILDVAGGRIFLAAFTPGAEATRLWTSDGSEAGTRIVGDVEPSAGETRAATTLGSVLFFAGSDAEHGSELWRSDGTAAATIRIFDINPGPEGSAIHTLVATGNRVFFVAWDGEAFGLWKTDGTAAGTRKLHDLDGWSGYDLTPVGNRVFFSNSVRTELWTSDGTAEGTFALRAIRATDLTRVGGYLFFSGDDAEHGIELWRSDGTAAGTVLVRDVLPGPFPSVALPSNGPLIVNAAGLVLFAAEDGEHGTELWVSDGTSVGTRLLQDIDPGMPSSLPTRLIVSGARVYFVADDGATGNELWAVALSDVLGRPERVLTPPPLPPRPPRTLLERH